jgi:hypothetical protein
MAHELAGVTTCRLCQRKFTGPSAVIIGDHPEGRLMRYVQDLTRHVMVDHENEDKSAQISAMEFLGALRLLFYSSTDPAISTQADFLRWRVHQSTMAVTSTDAQLKLKSAETAAALAAELILLGKEEQLEDAAFVERMKTTITERLTPILTGLRDELQEAGRYAVSMVTVPGNSKNGPH